jgi:2-aminoadipate transaminase
MDLELDRTSKVPLHRQIAKQLSERIISGGLPHGAQLPPTRGLAQSLGVARSTVVQAYNRLWSDGFIKGHVGQGTVVQGPDGGRRGLSESLAWTSLLVPSRDNVSGETKELMRLLADDNLISLAGGLPGTDFYPLAEIRSISDAVFDSEGGDLLRWCPIDGYPLLKALLAQEMPDVSPHEVLILSGSQQGLSLLARALIEPGDSVVVEEPSFLGALQVFREAGARLIGIPVDADGIEMRMLEDVLARRRPKFIYTLPTFQNPAGVTMPLERRERLLELAYRHGVAVIEDDPYSLLRYEGDSLASLKALDTRGHVIYLSTFSKVLFPGFRIGWMMAPQPVIERVVALKQMADLFTNSVSQAVLHRFCEQGLLAEHLERVRDAYRKRRDVMARALERHCPDVRFTVPQGGYYLWCRLPEGVTARGLLREALKLGVAFLNGDVFFPDRRGEDWMRLNFTSQTPKAIREGVKRLGVAIETVRREEGTGTPDAETCTRPIV